MTNNKIAKPILSLEDAREMKDFYLYQYQNRVYRYKQNGIVRLIHEEKDIAEGLGAKGAEYLKFDNKNKPVFTFWTKTRKDRGVCYNGEVLRGGWKSIRSIEFVQDNKLAFVFISDKSWGVWYDGDAYGRDWKGADIYRDCISYRTKDGKSTTLSYEELKNSKNLLTGKNI